MKQLAELMSLQGRVALITGGAGYLGMAMAEALAELGCGLCLLDREETTLVRAADAIGKEWGVSVQTLAVDLENEAARSEVPGKIQDRFGRLDILINNAGFVGDSQLQGWVVPFEEQRVDTWRRALEVNLSAVFHLCQILSPMLKAVGKGAIVNISSIYGVVGPDLRLYEGTKMGNPAAYAASKGGMVQLTRWLATVLAPHVRVNCISPGGVSRGQPPEFVERYVARTPLGRMGTEEDFKGAIAYLASDLSSWVTGENLMVDGGWTAW
ncbi:MAG: SDR family oxidoreductase [Sulfuricellaceae bacterium]|jgi:NAD(P)-dependent dehydrogenase (short-subunit alcohol dehydrogenase family)